MGGVLIDTHALIWFMHGDNSLSVTARQVLEDAETRRYVSVATLWEMSIKVSLGKLNLDRSLPDFFNRYLDDFDFTILPIERSHLLTLQTLFPHHRDPFDRLLIAQSIAEGLPLVSGDANVALYPVQRVW